MGNVHGEKGCVGGGSHVKSWGHELEPGSRAWSRGRGYGGHGMERAERAEGGESGHWGGESGEGGAGGHVLGPFQVI